MFIDLLIDQETICEDVFKIINGLMALFISLYEIVINCRKGDLKSWKP